MMTGNVTLWLCTWVCGKRIPRSILSRSFKVSFSVGRLDDLIGPFPLIGPYSLSGKKYSSAQYNTASKVSKEAKKLNHVILLRTDADRPERPERPECSGDDLLYCSLSSLNFLHSSSTKV